ncbi:MAG: hypothetical protein WAW75_06685, partial [Gallionella sp.]
MLLQVWDFRLFDSAWTEVIIGSIAMDANTAAIFFMVSSQSTLFAYISVCICVERQQIKKPEWL